MSTRKQCSASSYFEGALDTLKESLFSVQITVLHYLQV